MLSPQSTIRVHGSNGCLEVKFTVRGWSSLFKQASVLNPQSTIRVHGSHFSPEGGRCSVHNPQSEFTVQAFLWHRPQGRPVQIHGSSSQFELLQSSRLNFIAQFDVDEEGDTTDLSLEVSEYDSSPDADYQSWFILEPVEEAVPAQ